MNITYQGKAITIATSNLPQKFVGKLINLKGSPSDGYSAQIVDVNGLVVGKGINYMDGNGWYCYATT